MEGKEIFHEMGGKEFTTVPCLNDGNEFVALLSKWIKEWAANETVLA